MIWSAGFGALALLYAVGLDAGPRGWTVALLVTAWSWRLALHLLVDRVLKSTGEDGRYARIRQEKGDAFQRWLLGFFLAQGISVVVLSIAPLVAILDPRAPSGPSFVLGILIFATSILGESIADRQLRRFKADPGSRGKVCRVGLWRYSRHPNYFFEWLHWLAYVAFTIGHPYGWVTWFAPVVMLFLMLKVTGIPPTEEQAVRSRGDAYREYQQTTSAFFPWFPREPQASASATRSPAP